MLTNNRRVRQLFTRNNPLKPSLYPNTTPLQYRTALQGRAQRFFCRATLCYRGICCRRVSLRPPVCPSVRPSRAGIVSKRRDESGWFWHGGFLPPIPHCYKEIWVSPKIRVLPSRTLSQIPDVENFATASRSRRQQNSSSSSSTVEFC